MTRISVRLRIEIEKELCNSVLKAIEPDNLSVPSGVSISTMCVDNMLYAEIRGDNVRVLTIRNTVDDLLEHISIAYRCLKKVLSDRSL